MLRAHAHDPPFEFSGWGSPRPARTTRVEFPPSPAPAPKPFASPSPSPQPIPGGPDVVDPLHRSRDDSDPLLLARTLPSPRSAPATEERQPRCLRHVRPSRQSPALKTSRPPARPFGPFPTEDSARISDLKSQLQGSNSTFGSTSPSRWSKGCSVRMLIYLARPPQNKYLQLNNSRSWLKMHFWDFGFRVRF